MVFILAVTGYNGAINKSNYDRDKDLLKGQAELLEKRLALELITLAQSTSNYVGELNQKSEARLLQYTGLGISNSQNAIAMRLKEQGEKHTV